MQNNRSPEKYGFLRWVTFLVHRRCINSAKYQLECVSMLLNIVFDLAKPIKT